MDKVWFLSAGGERHEDHIPYGVFTDLKEVEAALRKAWEIPEDTLGWELEVTIVGDDEREFCVVTYEVKDGVRVEDTREQSDEYSAVTARQVLLNEYSPEILNT